MTTTQMTYQDFEAARAYTAEAEGEQTDSFLFCDKSTQTVKISGYGSRQIARSLLGREVSIADLYEMPIRNDWDQIAPELPVGHKFSTLLINSGLRGVGHTALSTAATFAMSYLNSPNKPLRLTQELQVIGSLADLSNSRAVLAFLSRNYDIIELIKSALRTTYAFPEICDRRIWVFNDPEDGSQSLYIGATVNAPEYEAVFQIENAVFEQSMQRHAELNQFRVLLSFDLKDNGQSE